MPNRVMFSNKTALKNAVERLDWKIQRFPTNKARDKAQAKKMETPAMKDALKKAEDKFIELYNIKAQKPNNVNILNTFPKIFT